MYDEETEAYTNDVEELSGKIADLTKTASKPGGISLFTDTNKTTYKSTYQLLKDISEIYDDLTDKQQAGLLEALAGKRQGQVVAATLKNFGAAEEALDNMANSAGNAEAEMDIIRESAAYALNELKETFTELSQNAVSRGELKNLIKFGTSLLTVVNALVKTFGSLPVVIGTAAGAITLFKRKGEGLLGYNANGNLTVMGADTSKGFKSWFAEKTDPTGAKAQLKNEVAAVKEFDNAIKTNSMNLRTYNAVMKSSNDNVKRYGRSVMNGTDQTKAFKLVNKQLHKELKQVGKSARTAADGTKRLSFGLKAVNAVASTITSMGIAMIAAKIIEVGSSMIHWAEKNSEKADEFAEKAKSVESRISDVNDELSKTKLRIDELSRLENPTIIQQEELDKLIETNDELERLLKTLRAQAKDNANQAADATVEWWKTIHYGGVGSTDNSWITSAIRWMPRLFGGAAADLKKESYSSFLGAIAEYKDLQEEITKKEQELSEATDDSYIVKLKDQIDDLNEKLTKAENIAEHNYAEWTAKMDTLNLDIPEQKEIFDQMNQLVYYWEYFSGKIKAELVDIVNDPNYAVVKQHLIDLWKQGKLTEDEFAKITDETVSGFEKFKQALTDNGYDDFAETIRAISTYFEETVEDVGNAAKAIRNFSEILDVVQEKIDSFISQQEKLVEAFKKIELGGKLAANEVYDLVKEMPTLAKYLTETASGWTISSENFSKASKESIESEKQELQTRIDTIRSYLETLGMAQSLGNQVEYSYDDPLLKVEYENAIKKARSLYGTLGISSDEEIGKAVDDLSEELNGLLFLVDLVDKTFDRHKIAVEGINEAYKNSKSEIDEYNNEIQTLDNVIKTLNEGNLLSYDEMNAIIDIAPELQDSFKSQADGYSIATNALEEWREKSYKARNEYIDGLIEQTKAEINSVNATIGTYQKRIEELRSAGVDVNVTTITDLLGDIDGANAQLETLYNVLNKFQGLRNDITYENEKKVTEELQNKIDYYKNILDAVSAVKDRYTEVLDNEIDALEENKDALKDANDERQRELDLIEARNNLENAKKRKVYVYTEGEGFKQVQDKAAVKEAEEKYRDAITDVQTAEIDKAIEEREKQKEALEQNTKDLLELEQNIQDSMAISKAIKALGLSDPSQLLNLPENVKKSIINSLADATIQKDNEDSKENTKHIAVTLDSVLANLGSNKTMADLSPDILDNVKQAAYNNVVRDFVDTLKSNADSMVNNVSYNNSPTLNANFNIYDAKDPQAVAETVRQELNDFLVEYYNAIK